jgi:ornithine cyclodeaminase/alanine dehydrogenase-like protein (mu-crystallin family)
MSEPKVEVLILSKEEVESLITRQEVVEAVESAFKVWGTGQLVQPQKEPMFMDDKRLNIFVSEPAYLKSLGIAGLKWANLYFNRQGYDIPASWGILTILNKPETGLPYVIMDGTAITRMRTGGGHAVVAAKYLAKKNSKTLGIVGCGVESRTGFRGILDNFPIETVKIYDIKSEAMAALQEEMNQEFSVKIVPTGSPKEAVEGTDIVLMTTSHRAKEPVVFEPWIGPGCFVDGIVGFMDLDSTLSKKADKWVLGHRESDNFLIVEAKTGYGAKLSIDDVYADMGEIVTGKKPGRENDNERIVYTHMGMGAHDVAVAQKVYEKAVAKGIGLKVYL